jgi:hypothetical protein
LPVLIRESYINLLYEAKLLDLQIQAVVCPGAVGHDLTTLASGSIMPKFYIQSARDPSQQMMFLSSTSD